MYWTKYNLQYCELIACNSKSEKFIWFKLEKKSVCSSKLRSSANCFLQNKIWNKARMVFYIQICNIHTYIGCYTMRYTFFYFLFFCIIYPIFILQSFLIYIICIFYGSYIFLNNLLQNGHEWFYLGILLILYCYEYGAMTRRDILKICKHMYDCSYGNETRVYHIISSVWKDVPLTEGRDIKTVTVLNALSLVDFNWTCPNFETLHFWREFLNWF